MTRKIMLTVDVEAFDNRAVPDNGSPVSQLIWARFDEGEHKGDFGISRMMEVASANRAKMVMYVDYAEDFVHPGEPMLDVARRIQHSGHEAAIHLHLESFPPDFCKQRGLRPFTTLNLVDQAQAAAVVDYLIARQAMAGASKPLSFRGGGYRYNDILLNEFKRRGIEISSNYNGAARHQPYNVGDRNTFFWEGDVIELPVATLLNFRGKKYRTHFNFDINSFSEPSIEQGVKNSLEFLNKYFATHGEDALAVFVLHSHSFLEMDETGRFSRPKPNAPERFDAMLKAWTAAGYEFVSSDDVLNGRVVPLAGPLAYPELVDERLPLDFGDLAPPEVPVASTAEACAICGTPVEKFESYNGGERRRCPSCGSTERQRAFAQAYDKFICNEINLSKAELLVVAPIASERSMFSKRNISKFKTLDIRPQFRPDYMVDICNMPDVPSSTFDAVFASFVLTCVYDLDACLREIYRILKPGGKLISCDPTKINAPTIEHTDVEKITAWYGKDGYDSFKIGNFRNFGDEDMLHTLQQFFVVKTFPEIDFATKSKWTWVTSTKRIDKSAAAAAA